MSAHATTCAIIGAGPAGLIAAEYLAGLGHHVTVFDAMPSPLRKFLLAGRGGLNLTHSEPIDSFLRRFGAPHPFLAAAIEAYPPDALRQWADELGETTFVGSSGRVFPRSFKATPLARAWLHRLRQCNVAFHFRHRWTGWDEDGALTFTTPKGPLAVKSSATLLALGGASWPRLGSDGSWQVPLAARAITITALEASNVGISVKWSDDFAARDAGQPLKGCCFSIAGQSSRAEAVVTANGLEGGAVYALSPALRAALRQDEATLMVDLRPDVPVESLTARIAAQRKGETLSNLLRKSANLTHTAIGLMREATGGNVPRDPPVLAALIKAVPLKIESLNTLTRAISTAGGISFDELDSGFQLKRIPGVFIAGEMLDWDAPTGGYLLQACFASGMTAARGIAGSLSQRTASDAT